MELYYAAVETMAPVSSQAVLLCNMLIVRSCVLQPAVCREWGGPPWLDQVRTVNFMTSRTAQLMQVMLMVHRVRSPGHRSWWSMLLKISLEQIQFSPRHLDHAKVQSLCILPPLRVACNTCQTASSHPFSVLLLNSKEKQHLLLSVV